MADKDKISKKDLIFIAVFPEVTQGCAQVRVYETGNRQRKGTMLYGTGM
jgi:hypothetical protein